MRSILLILGLTVCMSGLKLDLWKKLSISDKTLALIKKGLGDIDIKQRFLKLRNLASRKVTKLTKEKDKELKERISKIRKTVIQKPPGVNAIDLFEINQQSGIANFLYEGDINLTEEQLNQMTKSAAGYSNLSGGRVKRGAASRIAPKWPNGTVYYYYDTSIIKDKGKVDAINAALLFLEAKTCIRFQHSRDNPDRIKVIDGGACYSEVGMIGQEQSLSIGDDCQAIGIVVHEFAHALGFLHTQARFDREEYITVVYSNIMPTQRFDFDMLTQNESINYTPYEYGGIMQYSVDSFSATANIGTVQYAAGSISAAPNIMNSSSFTMIPKDIEFVHTMGNRMNKFYDLQMFNDHYGCSAKCPVTTSAKCHNGGLPNPNNCTRCNCPLGYAGDLCDQMPPVSGGCGGELNATSAWRAKSFKFGENTIDRRNQFTECHHWIKAPADTKIEVRISSMKNAFCNYGCQLNGIEFKLMANKRMTNPKICCEEFLYQHYFGELNPMPVIAHNRYGITEFTIEYRIDPATIPPSISRPCTPCPPGNKKKERCCSV